MLPGKMFSVPYSFWWDVAHEMVDAGIMTISNPFLSIDFYRGNQEKVTAWSHLRYIMYYLEPSPAFCTGDMCAITYSNHTQQVQSCITNINMNIGCFGHPSFRTICTCNTDECNADPFNMTGTSPANVLFEGTDISCADMKTEGECATPTCMFTNASSLYPNAVFIDQSSKIETDNKTNSVVVPTTSLIALCTKKNHYNIEERYKNSTRNYEALACYTFTDDKFDIHQFVQLEYYFCNHNYCNIDSVDVVKLSLEDAFPSHNSCFLQTKDSDTSMLSVLRWHEFKTFNPDCYSSPAFCTGDLCAITYFSDELQVQSCISNVRMEKGCFGNASLNTLCTCDTDRCNSADALMTRPHPFASLFEMELSTNNNCDSPTCLYTNAIFSLYPNAVFIDQSAVSDNTNNAVVVALCTLKECEEHYHIEELYSKYSRRFDPVACYTSSNDICYGHLCYANKYNGTTTRGCVDYAYDTLWRQGKTQVFEHLVDDRRKGVQKFSVHQFLQLEYYFCNYDNCNIGSVSDVKGSGYGHGTAQSSTISRYSCALLNGVILAVSILLKDCIAPAHRNQMNACLLRGLAISIIFIPLACSLVQCIQAYEGMSASTPNTCNGSMCAITYLAGKLQVQTCISNVGMMGGCWGNTTNRIVCVCSTDRCNSDPYKITKASMPSELFGPDIFCPEQNPTGLCDSPTCMFANDTSSLYPNAIFIDQTACADKYNTGSYTRANAPIACSTNSDALNGTTQPCYGQVCYTNAFNGSNTRGCTDYVYDTLWEQGYTQIFEYLTKDRLNGTRRFSLHKFLLLEYYFCNYDYCNLDTVSDYRIYGPRTSLYSTTASSITATTTKSSSSFSFLCSVVVLVFEIRVRNTGSPSPHFTHSLTGQRDERVCEMKRRLPVFRTLLHSSWRGGGGKQDAMRNAVAIRAVMVKNPSLHSEYSLVTLTVFMMKIPPSKVEQ
ncbi:hypothetical protein PRIPAC_82521, partial [Pristionchus pacificus]|uniref:Uncharacterized protein n=1 Tax=Pristionchus pacificus TaxID=54126 RepID=A0A2A6BWT6_PRIPA